MSFRTVVVKSRSKLETSLGYLVCRSEEGEKRVLISEISVLIIQSTAVSLTAALLSTLSKNKVKVIFCDEKNNPESELISLYDNTDSVKRIDEQISWLPETKQLLWSTIIYLKIKGQSLNLLRSGMKDAAKTLEEYANNILIGDSNNREGHAAKVYFNALFGKDFSRSQDNIINAALNYGYSLVLALINRHVVASGYLTQIGIHHANQFNYFNFSCDLIEPIRPIVDGLVLNLDFGSDFKIQLIKMFELEVLFDGEKMFFEQAIKRYCQSVFNALKENDVSLLKMFEKYEL